MVCILRGPYEHSLAFTGQLRSHFALANYFVVFGVTQRMGLILKGGMLGEGGGTSGNRTAGVSKIKQVSSVNRNRKAHPGKAIHRLKEFFVPLSNQWNEFKNKFHSWLALHLPDDLFFYVNMSSRRSDVSSPSLWGTLNPLQILPQLLRTAIKLDLSSLWCKDDYYADSSYSFYFHTSLSWSNINNSATHCRTCCGTQ